MRLVRRLLGIGLFVAVLVIGWQFAARNAAPVRIDVLVLELPEVSLWLALVVSFGAGAAIAGLYGLYRTARLGLLARRYRKTVSGLEAEVHQLRNLPLEMDGPAADPRSSDAPPGGALGRGT